jgi:hypothetical protein
MRRIPVLQQYFHNSHKRGNNLTVSDRYFRHFLSSQSKTHPEFCRIENFMLLQRQEGIQKKGEKIETYIMH